MHTSYLLPITFGYQLFLYNKLWYHVELWYDNLRFRYRTGALGFAHLILQRGDLKLGVLPLCQ